MTAAPMCDDVIERDLAREYLAGTLSSADEALVELHMLGCARCQSEIRLVSAVGALGKSRSRSAARVTSFVGVAAAATLIAALFAGQSNQSGSSPTSLGSIPGAPVYLGMPVRDEVSVRESLFAAGMAAYVSEDYPRAERTLRSALAGGVDSAAAGFFVGASVLMQSRHAEAAELFGDVVARGDTPFLAESRFYRAKALLRGRRYSEALAELRALASIEHELAEPATALADSVAAIIRR